MPAFYFNSIQGFQKDSSNHIIGELTSKSGLAGFEKQRHTQTKSWSREIELLKNLFLNITSDNSSAKDWSILLEYPIPRRDKRIDVILLAHNVVIVIEFKSDSNKYDRSSQLQLLDYCLDLKDFHKESANTIIIPFLLCTDAEIVENTFDYLQKDLVKIQFANRSNLYAVFKNLITKFIDLNIVAINPIEWNKSKYFPTPTIIEAAIKLFSSNTVHDIAQSHAGRKNLTHTTEAILNAVTYARNNKKKIICFVTGVPGAGKTLAGLSIAHHPSLQKLNNADATFLSGNGPLIKVLRTSLARNANSKDNYTESIRLTNRKVAFIENAHTFFDNNFDYSTGKATKPNNRIVIFDEAQRAWNAEHSERKFGRKFSEPELMFRIMQKHKDWAVIVALIGGGQEINTGEAGLREWGKNLETKFSGWEIFISPELKSGNHSTGNLKLFDKVPSHIKTHENEDLHLNVSIRSYKAEKLSQWVQMVLDNNPDKANKILTTTLKEYNIFITRSLDKAKRWLKEKCLGSRRMGLVASSGGRRLRAYGIDVKTELEEENWFLNPRGDMRSSYSLEVAATEFGIQGLELDWIGVCWDADLRRKNNEWYFKKFKGAKWNIKEIEDPVVKNFIKNKYRVLLTRARQGMVIWIPEGDIEDETALPEFYDPIFNYLKSCGVPELE